MGKQTNLTKIEEYSSTAVEGKEFTDDSKTTLNTTNFDRYADMLPWWIMLPRLNPVKSVKALIC